MKYILLIGAIINIGGGQSYCSNKVAELEKRGFRVFVISSEDRLDEVFDVRKEDVDFLLYKLKRHLGRLGKPYIKQSLEKSMRIVCNEKIALCPITCLIESRCAYAC